MNELYLVIERSNCTYYTGFMQLVHDPGLLAEKKQKYKSTGIRLKTPIFIFLRTHRHRRASFRSRLSIVFFTAEI